MGEVIKSLLTFNWATGWRTYSIIVVVVAGTLLEQVLMVDIPGVAFTWDSVVLALGLGAAANHEKKS